LNCQANKKYPRIMLACFTDARGFSEKQRLGPQCGGQQPRFLSK
jgi:hypothetical protein